MRFDGNDFENGKFFDQLFRLRSFQATRLVVPASAFQVQTANVRTYEKTALQWWKKRMSQLEHQNLEVEYRIWDAKRLSLSYETKILSCQNLRLGPLANGSPLAQTFFCIVCLSSFLVLRKLSLFQNRASWLLGSQKLHFKAEKPLHSLLAKKKEILAFHISKEILPRWKDILNCHPFS